MRASLDDSIDDFDWDDAPRKHKPDDPGTWVESDDGTEVLVPTYKGEAPYSAPLVGFKGKMGEVFDVFAYFPTDPASRKRRPEAFVPVIGLVGNDPAKEKDRQHWQLCARLRPDIWKRVANEIDGEVPALLVTPVRSDHTMLVSVMRAQALFTLNPWIATLPLKISRTPVPTLSDLELNRLLAAGRARKLAGEDSAYNEHQLALGF